MKSLTREQVLSYIESLTLTEINAFVTELKERLGVDDMPSLARLPIVAQTPVDITPTQTEFAVMLMSYGDKKVSVIREVRSITNLGLRESRDLVDAVPALISDGLCADEADAMKAQLEAAGGTVELK